jgi:hypothetical protein
VSRHTGIDVSRNLAQTRAHTISQFGGVRVVGNLEVQESRGITVAVASGVVMMYKEYLLGTVRDVLKSWVESQVKHKKE